MEIRFLRFNISVNKCQDERLEKESGGNIQINNS